jgi:hypothetical protein
MAYPHYYPVLESRIDWLTCTCKPGHKAQVLQASAEKWIAAQGALGFRPREFRWSGYLGTATDGITCGKREDGTILRLSGETAYHNAKHCLAFCDNVSRIDVQVTLLAKEDPSDFAQLSLSSASIDTRVESGITRTSIIRSTPNGSTFYLGSRASERFYRVYDKTAESDGVYPDRSWRWEVEYKGDRAWRVSQQLVKMGFTAEAIRQVVEQAFYNYGINLPCLALPPTWRDAGIRAETNDQKRLIWLAKSIAPCIAKLREGIPLDTVLDALGLYDTFDPRTGSIYPPGRAEALADIHRNPPSLYNKNRVEILAALDERAIEPG